MKITISLFIFALSLCAFAKKDIDFKSFNQKMNENIQHVVEENPHLYETKPLDRKPASVKTLETESTEKLDEIEEQADTHLKW